LNDRTPNATWKTLAAVPLTVAVILAICAILGATKTIDLGISQSKAVKRKELGVKLPRELGMVVANWNDTSNTSSPRGALDNTNERETSSSNNKEVGIGGVVTTVTNPGAMIEILTKSGGEKNAVSVPESGKFIPMDRPT